MPKSTWTIAAVLSALLLLGIAALQVRESNLAARQAREELAAAQAAADAAGAVTNTLTASLTAAQARVTELEQQIEQATQAKDSLEQQMRSALESRDVTISELQGKLTVNILDRVLYDSGDDTLRPEGEQVLAKVARVLAQYPNRQVQIVGHTDNVPIVGRTRSGFTDNWHLSSGRALAALRYLQTRAGVDPRRLSAVGCGEFRPLADNATPEGRARNRRIAVVVLPEEIVPVDVPRPKPGEVVPPKPGAGPTTEVPPVPAVVPAGVPAPTPLPEPAAPKP